MRRLPSGTVTLVFTDIEGSTRLLQELGVDRYVQALEDHRRLLRGAFSRRGGVEVEMQGDSFHFAFADAGAAVAAAEEAQGALAAHAWGESPVRVRMGVHSGEPVVSGDLYAGLDVHRAARVMSAAHGGQVLVSETTFQLLGETSPLRDLGEHRLKDLLAPVRLYQLGDGEFPPVRSLYRTNLPVPPTPFLGRERELAELAALLEEGQARLLTLVGPGGSGKTRLAVQAAAEAAERYVDGITWVGLAPLRDPELVLPTIAQALEATSDVAEEIGDKRLLLVLDNFEQLVDAAPELAALLAGCPNLTVVVTSREPLHVRAERVYSVAPLLETDAVALFRERARAAGVDLAANGEIGEICRRLDHLPLAIELAAARTPSLPPEALLRRLARRLPLLTGGPRDVPERQQTLRNAIAWSFELLAPAEQTIFARLAVFAGGATLEAAEHVCDATLDTLQSLLDKSLLRRTNDRYWLLETIREYAGDRLAELEADLATQRRHAGFYRTLVEEAYPELRGPNQAEWLERLEREHDNLRAVLGFGLELGEGEATVRLAGALARFWMIRGHLSEGRRWLEESLEAAPAAAARPLALRGLATLAIEQGDLERAAQSAQEALDLDRAAHDEDGVVHSLGLVADAAAFGGDLTTAKGLYTEAASMARRRGERLQLAINLYNLGQIARLHDDPDGAEAHFDEARVLFDELEDTMGQAGALQGLVDVATSRGEHAHALALLARSAELYSRIHYVGGLLGVVEQAAMLLAETGQQGVSARLWAAHHGLSLEIGRTVSHTPEVEARDEAIAAVRATLGDEMFDRAWEEGLALTIEDAIAEARAATAAVAEPAP